MANQQNSVELLIRARDETQKAIRSAQSGMERFAAAQKRTMARRELVGGRLNELESLATEYQTLQREVGRLGQKMSEAKRPSKALVAEFETQRARASALKRELREKALAYGQLTTSSRGSFAAMDAVARGMTREQAATNASTAALNANTAAMGRNAAAARGRGRAGMANAVEDAYTSRQGRGPLGLRPHEMQNLSYQINDVVTQLASGTPVFQVFAQQSGQIAQIFPGLISGFVRLAPVIGLATLALAPFVSELNRANSAAKTLKEMDLLLTRSGNAANYSKEELASLVQILRQYGASVDDARASVSAMVGDSVAPAYMERFGKTALDVAKVLKVDVSEASAKVTDAFTGNADAILALDDELNFLSATERKHIQQLRESKRDAEARTKAFEIFERRYGETAAKMRGPWSQILRDFGAAWRSFAEWVNFIDFGKARRQIDDLIARVQRLTRMLPGANVANAANTRATYHRNREQAENLEDQARSGRPMGNAVRQRLLERANQLRQENRRLQVRLQTQEALEAGGLLGTPPSGPDTTTAPPPPANSSEPKKDRDAERRAKAQADFLKDLNAENEARRFQLQMIDQEERERRILEELREKELAAQEVGLQLSKEQKAEIRETVGALYDAEKAYEAIRLIEEARRDLAEAQGQRESREDFIARRLRDAGLYTGELDEATGEWVSTLTEAGQEYAEILRKLWDINEATRQRQEAEKAVNDLVALRSTMQERVSFLEESGNTAGADALREQIIALDAEIVKAAEHAIALIQALGGEGAQQAIMTLQTIRDTAGGLGEKAMISGKQINEMLASGGANAFDQFAQSIAEGQNAISALRDSFLQFAADFLRQIAQMIIQQLLLNAISGMMGGGGGGGGGIGGFISGLIGGGIKRHSGGEINSTGSIGRPIPRAVWAGAQVLHKGGIVGMPDLKPNEVPIIGLRGEEMLTEDDPRHRKNLGGGGGSQQSVKVVNVLDPNDLLDRALGSDEGERIFLNFVRRNPGAFKAAMGS